MIVKFLLIIAFLVLVMYVVLPRRGANEPASRARRLFIALCAGSVGALTGSLISVVLWMGASASVASGSGRGGGGSDALLGLSALLLVISIGCAVGAMIKRVK